MLQENMFSLEILAMEKSGSPGGIGVYSERSIFFNINLRGIFSNECVMSLQTIFDNIFLAPI